MNERGEPRWELLPHDPLGFFGLTGSFDRKALKQRYTELIRRYKPEKYPDEFQKIRAAFDQLDAWLRLGREQQADPAAGPGLFMEQDDLQEPIDHFICALPAPLQPEQERVLHLATRLESEEPSQLYQELEHRQRKSVQDYYALAVLSDLVEPGNRLAFPRWVLEGIKAFPQDRALAALLSETLRQTDFGDDNAAVLLQVSQVITTDQFYYYTEPLWRRVIKREPGADFVAVLAQCEQNLRDHQIEARVAFYVRILRVALWHAPDPWITKSTAYMKEHHDQLSDELEYEMELNLQLARYRGVAHLFRDGSPERESIDGCIRAYCELEEEQAAEHVLRTQLALAAERRSLLDALPFDEVKDHSAAYEALRWITHASHVRLGIDWTPPDRDAVWNDTIRFMKAVNSQEDHNTWQLLALLKHILDFGMLFFLAVGVAIPAALMIVLVATRGLRLPAENPDVFLILSLVAAIICTSVLYLAVLRKRTTTRWFGMWEERIARRKYRRRWRIQVFWFLCRTQYPLEDVRSTLSTIEQQSLGSSKTVTWLSRFLKQDFGLAFCALASRYQC